MLGSIVGNKYSLISKKWASVVRVQKGLLSSDLKETIMIMTYDDNDNDLW